MNSLIGKSTGIALLMAAALLAALFAMGVFAPAGVGAQTTPSVSASYDSRTATTINDDRVRFNFSGLKAIDANDGNQIVISLDPNDIGNIDGGDADWSDSGGAYASESDTYASSALTIGFPSDFAIAGGTARLDLELPNDHGFDSNTKITKITIGRGTAAQGNLIEIPIADGLDISGVRKGRTITLDKKAAPGGGESATTVTVSGTLFGASNGDTDVTLSATKPGATADATPIPVDIDGDATNGENTVSIVNAADADTCVVTSTDKICAGVFTQEISIPAQASGTVVTITASQPTDGDSTTATFKFANAPVIVATPALPTTELGYDHRYASIVGHSG